MSKSDAFEPFDPLLAATPLSDPWLHDRGQQPVYAPDYDLLGRLLTLPVAAGSASESPNGWWDDSCAASGATKTNTTVSS